MPNWEEIRNEWETTKVTFKALAEKHNVKDSTIRSRKNREKWQRNGDSKKTQRATQRKQNVATKRERREPAVMSDDLTDKQKLFCIYYIKYFNATKAYQKAYECAYTTAMVEGHRHLRNPKISREIDRMRNETLNEKRLRADDILQKYIDIAFADITDFMEFGRKEVEMVDEFGDIHMREVNYLDFKDSSEVDGTIVTEVRQGKDGVSVKLADKMKAMDMLAKYTDLLSDNDRKRLQEEKLKAEKAKLDAELENISNDNANNGGDDWTEALLEVAERRRVLNEEK